jgi:hypothetical protein
MVWQYIKGEHVSVNSHLYSVCSNHCSTLAQLIPDYIVIIVKQFSEYCQYFVLNDYLVIQCATRVTMATKLNQSCVDCSISYLGNRSHCLNESTLSHSMTTKRKSPKWHQRLFKRSTQQLSSSYLSLDVLDNFEYPFNVTVSSFSSELTGSDWSLSSSSTQSSDTTSSNITIETDHNDMGYHKKNSSHIFYSKSIAHTFKNRKNQAKIVPLWSSYIY